MTAIFITATGTDIGKTFVTAGLTRALRAAGRNPLALKPVISGFDMAALAESDTGILLTAMGCPLTQSQADRISPWRFKAPLSPDMAAKRENKEIAFDTLIAFCRDQIATHEVVLIEGAGGVMSPLDERHTMLDWSAALKIPTILVTGSYLGAISHCLSALESLKAGRVPVLAIAISQTEGSTVDFHDSAASIRRFIDPIPCIEVQRLTDTTHAHPGIAALCRFL